MRPTRARPARSRAASTVSGGTHASIVSRELGIPAAVSVTDATRRIADGSLVTVDGNAGTVLVH